MKDSVFKIRNNRQIADKTWRMELEGDTSALTRGGQFVDIALEGRFLRRPFAAQKWDGSSMTIIYKTVGEGTIEMTRLEEGCELDILTGLGNGFDPDACKSGALIACGGLGASPAFTLAKELIASGKKVTAILGFNKSDEIILAQEYEALGAETRIVTLDGSTGIKGFVTDAIRELDAEFDYFYACGPKVMMKAVCDMMTIPGEASLEERMGCGCGICYGCTCRTAKGPRRICADGPVFKKEDIIW